MAEETTRRTPWMISPEDNCHRSEGLILKSVFLAPILQVIKCVYIFSNLEIEIQYDYALKFFTYTCGGKVMVSEVDHEAFIKVEKGEYTLDDVDAFIEDVQSAKLMMQWIPDIEAEIICIVDREIYQKV